MSGMDRVGIQVGYAQVSPHIASGSFDEGGGSRAICSGDNFVSDIVGKDVVVFGESING